MAGFPRTSVFVVLTLHFTFMVASPLPGIDSRGNRTQRDVFCKDEEYLDGSICCLNCPAGTYLKSSCTRAGQMGTCEKCIDGTYTEYANHLKHCLPCTRCNQDEEVVKPCTVKTNSECQCRAGGFCHPEQACELCTKCSRCDKNEIIVRNCTATSDTLCDKVVDPELDKNLGTIYNPGIVAVIVITAIVLFVVVLLGIWKCRRRIDTQGNGLKAGEDRKTGQTQQQGCSTRILPRQLVRAATKDEREELCDSLDSSASNSTHSLTGLPAAALLAPPPQPSSTRDEHFPKLAPVNGEQSLRQCFEYFEEIDIDYHKRFFRHLGIADNVIKSKEQLPYEDKIHELLNIWVEKKGREASLDDLLKELLDLNQRRTAENVKENAINNGHYVCDQSLQISCSD